MGNSDFSCSVLQAIINNNFIINSIITSINKKTGRGQKIKNKKITEIAKKNKINIIKTDNLNDMSIKKKYLNSIQI